MLGRTAHSGTRLIGGDEKPVPGSLKLLMAQVRMLHSKPQGTTEVPQSQVPGEVGDKWAAHLPPSKGSPGSCLWVKGFVMWKPLQGRSFAVD